MRSVWGVFSHDNIDIQTILPIDLTFYCSVLCSTSSFRAALPPAPPKKVHVDCWRLPEILPFPSEPQQAQEPPIAPSLAAAPSQMPLPSSFPVPPYVVGGQLTAAGNVGVGGLALAPPQQNFVTAGVSSMLQYITTTSPQHQYLHLNQTSVATEELSVDVSAPGGLFSPFSTLPAMDTNNIFSSPPPPPPQERRVAPDRDLPCCFCGSADGALLDCGVTECGVGGGGCCRHGEGPSPVDGGAVAPDGNKGDGIGVCGRRFHFLCAWFEGAYVRVSVTDPTFTRGERGPAGDMDSWPEPGHALFGFPAGISVEVRCLEHSVGAPGRKRAPASQEMVKKAAGAGLGVGGVGVLGGEGGLVKGTTSEEQMELRSKYRLKVCIDYNISTPGVARSDFSPVFYFIIIGPNSLLVFSHNAK